MFLLFDIRKIKIQIFFNLLIDLNKYALIYLYLRIFQNIEIDIKSNKCNALLIIECNKKTQSRINQTSVE